MAFAPPGPQENTRDDWHQPRSGAHGKSLQNNQAVGELGSDGSTISSGAGHGTSPTLCFSLPFTQPPEVG